MIELQNFTDNWSDMSEVSVCENSEKKWIKRCLKSNESPEDKKILLLMVEGSVSENPPQEGAVWYKIAIKDTSGIEPKILLRSIYIGNIIENKKIITQTDDW